MNAIIEKRPHCPYCTSRNVRKHGYSRAKLRRYRCLTCGITFQGEYIYPGCKFKSYS
ncbi:IS1/IS1595 family N-terminal zinc-binding domain-containing protein [Leminorella grimontii]|uniref:IS1/IS1595 family N-terminal zinc-binding domain-containing protein n=1 Tax=Leminorella grimontii TaxID=82981 RepID=UPI003B8A637A